jgi:hypothetical protein
MGQTLQRGVQAARTAAPSTLKGVNNMKHANTVAIRIKAAPT